MKRLFVLFLCVFMMISCVSMFAEETIEPLNAYSEAPPQNSAKANANDYTESSSAIPLRFCFLPKVWYWPKGLDVYGLNLGLPMSFSEGEKMYGIDFALLASITDQVEGLQVSLVNKGFETDALELGIVNIATMLAGVQIGGVNTMNTSDAFQLGLINISHKSNGLQLGILNIMENGFLPVFPIINFSM